MNSAQIIEEAKKYFGKNRNLLKKKILSFKFDGSGYRKLSNQIKSIISQPFDLSYLMFDDVICWIKEEKISEIDWHWLGDLSWKIDVLLNENIEKGYDWDKKLALKCDGTARILRVYISDIIPCFVIDTYYMTYSKKENYYEFGPIIRLSNSEKQLVKKVELFFKDQGLTFIDKKTALTNYAELYSDCNSGGNATLFDALFCDTDNYQDKFIRFNDEDIFDQTRKKINWKEFYDKNGKLLRREEYRFFPSRNGLTTITDGLGQITEVKVWRDFGRKIHQEFKINLVDEFKKRKAEKKLSK